MGDPLFMLRNYYLIGAYNAAINEASDLEGLPAPLQVEKDAYVYRSYIELGSHDVSCFKRGSGGGPERGGVRACSPLFFAPFSPRARDADEADAQPNRLIDNQLNPTPNSSSSTRSPTPPPSASAPSSSSPRSAAGAPPRRTPSPP
jgi:hypothetical protein